MIAIKPRWHVHIIVESESVATTLSFFSVHFQCRMERKIISVHVPCTADHAVVTVRYANELLAAIDKRGAWTVV